MLDTTSHTCIITLPLKAVTFWLGTSEQLCPKNPLLPDGKKTQKMFGHSLAIQGGPEKRVKLILGAAANMVGFSCQCIRREQCDRIVTTVRNGVSLRRHSVKPDLLGEL